MHNWVLKAAARGKWEPKNKKKKQKPENKITKNIRLGVRVCAVDWRSEAEGVSRTGSVPKAVLTVEQGDGRQGIVVVWGTALTWLQHIHTNKGKECAD